MSTGPQKHLYINIFFYHFYHKNKITVHSHYQDITRYYYSLMCTEIGSFVLFLHDTYPKGIINNVNAC